jgi:hypothetical protein
LVAQDGKTLKLCDFGSCAVGRQPLGTQAERSHQEEVPCVLFEDSWGGGETEGGTEEAVLEITFFHNNHVYAFPSLHVTHSPK